MSKTPEPDSLMDSLVACEDRPRISQQIAQEKHSMDIPGIQLVEITHYAAIVGCYMLLKDLRALWIPSQYRFQRSTVARQLVDDLLLAFNEPIAALLHVERGWPTD